MIYATVSAPGWSDNSGGQIDPWFRFLYHILSQKHLHLSLYDLHQGGRKQSHIREAREVKSQSYHSNPTKTPTYL